MNNTPASQAVEVAVQKFMLLVDNCIHSPAHQEARECLEIALQRHLTKMQGRHNAT